MNLLLGIIADDFTGATDIASTLVKQGMRVTQFLGLPAAGMQTDDADAIVIALKSRTIPANDAIDQSLQALKWLRDRGAKQILFKYCSTFDSTADGNIGPVADALMDALDAEFALVCPAFPDNLRRVYQGHLFVGDQLLSDSPMRDHPLTPMRDSNLLRLLGSQSRKSVDLIAHEVVQAGRESVERAIRQCRENGHDYGVIDALSNADIDTIGSAASDHQLVTGGSAIAAGLAKALKRRGAFQVSTGNRPARAEGRELVIAGSCSSATLRQIEAVPNDWTSLRIELPLLVEKPALIGEMIESAIQAPGDQPVLVYASTGARELADIQSRHGVEQSACLIENALASIAVGLTGADFRRIIVAGGETSGAVLSALGIRSLDIGPEIDPGVPWTFTVDQPELALALKSGNFGRDDFFQHAFACLREMN